MMILLVPLTFIFVFLFFVSRSGGDYRGSFVQSFLVILLFIALSTEMLSLLNSINVSTLLFTWGLALIASIAAWLSVSLGSAGSLISSAREINIDLSWYEWVGAGFILFVLGVTLLIAVLAPPNNFDSMTYHMTRVAEWIQHQNVRFYPTNIPRQNHAMPLAEFSILHLQILSRSDRYANLVQWASFLTAIVLASLITKEFQGSRTGQVISGVLVATLPMAIVQSSSTQNDLVVGALCLGFAYFLLRVTRGLNWEDAFFSAVALGLALLTKGTAYIFCAGMGLGIGIGALLKLKNPDSRSKLILCLSLIVSGAILINSGHYLRNIYFYNHPLSTANSRITVDNFSILNTIANLIRNTALHLGTPFSGFNDLLNRVVEIVLGPFVNHPDSTFEGTRFEIRYLINDDYAGNLFHIILVVAIFPLYLFQNKRYPARSHWYMIGNILAIILYSASIKWQPWGSRLQTPLFLLGLPGVVIVFENMNQPSYFHIAQAISLVVFISSLPFLLINSTRPLMPFFEKDSFLRSNVVQRFFSDRPVLYDEFSSLLSPFYQGRSVIHTDRQKLYFMSEFNMYWDYIGVMKEVERLKPREVGLCLGSNDWEYPFWVLAGRHASRGQPTFRHVQIENNTLELINGDKIPPEYVLATKSSCMTIYEHPYQEIFSSDSVQLLKRK